MFQQNIDIFCGGDAAEQNDLGLARQFFSQLFYVTFQGRTITRIIFVNVDFSKLAEVGETEGGNGRHQAACRRDDENG